MKPRYIVDLDDNLGQVLRKCPPGAGELRVMSVDREGTPRSFMTAKQSALFEMLRTAGDVTACTGRDLSALRRMRIPLDGHAIVSFGGAIVMPDGSFEPRWQALIMKAASQAAAELAELLKLAESVAGATNWPVDTRLVGETFAGQSTKLFVLIKRHDASHRELNGLQELLRTQVPKGWKVHRNDSTLALLPPFLRKGNAVKFFLEEVLEEKPVFTIGMGDSTDDGGFMALCDYAMMPTESQIFSLIRKEVTDVPR